MSPAENKRPSIASVARVLYIVIQARARAMHRAKCALVRISALACVPARARARASRMRLYYRECRRCATTRGKVAYSFVATRCIVSSREGKNRGGRAHSMAVSMVSPGGLWSRNGKIRCRVYQPRLEKIRCLPVDLPMYGAHPTDLRTLKYELSARAG